MHGGRGGGRGSNNLFFKPAPTMQNGGSRGGSRGKPSAAAGAGAQRPSMGAAGSNVPTASAGHHIDTANGLQKVEAAGQPTHGAVPHMQMHRMPYGHAPPHAKVRRPHPSPSPHLSGSVTIKPCSCTAGGPSYSLNLVNPDHTLIGLQDASRRGRELCPRLCQACSIASPSSPPPGSIGWAQAWLCFAARVEEILPQETQAHTLVAR